MASLPPFVVHGADRLGPDGPDGFRHHAARLRGALRALPDAEPLPFRPEAGGDYDEELVLRPELASGQAGLGVHYDPPRGLSG